MRNLFTVFAVAMLGSLVQAQMPPGCSDPFGAPNTKACVDNQWKVCECRGWQCYWICTGPGGNCLRCPTPKVDDSGAGGCSDPSDLDMDLRDELDSSASSCEFPCNCIASGNQIAHRLGVKTAAECDYFCKSFPKHCKFWTLIKSKNICFALTNCNYPKCGPPFNDYISGPRGCPPSTESLAAAPNSSFSVRNLAKNKVVTSGTASFSGTSKDCSGSIKNLAFGKVEIITVPTVCLPLIEFTATLNKQTVCKPLNGQVQFPQNVLICLSKDGLTCSVVADQPCPKK